jgi:hypothetical protein
VCLFLGKRPHLQGRFVIPAGHHAAKNEAKQKREARAKEEVGGGHLARTGGAGEYWSTTRNSSTKVPQVSNKNPHHCLRRCVPELARWLHLFLSSSFLLFKILTPTFLFFFFSAGLMC